MISPPKTCILRSQHQQLMQNGRLRSNIIDLPRHFSVEMRFELTGLRYPEHQKEILNLITPISDTEQPTLLRNCSSHSFNISAVILLLILDEESQTQEEGTSHEL